MLAIDPKLRPKWVELKDPSDESVAMVTVEWEDGHKSTYPVTWLKGHSYEWQGERSPSEDSARGAAFPTVWGQEISATPPLVKYDGFVDDDCVFLEWSDNVDQFGFCFIDGVPLEADSTKRLLERVGVLRHTFYGDFWDFEVNSRPKNELEMG